MGNAAGVDDCRILADENLWQHSSHWINGVPSPPLPPGFGGEKRPSSLRGEAGRKFRRATLTDEHDRSAGHRRVPRSPETVETVANAPPFRRAARGIASRPVPLRVGEDAAVGGDGPLKVANDPHVSELAASCGARPATSYPYAAT